VSSSGVCKNVGRMGKDWVGSHRSISVDPRGGLRFRTFAEVGLAVVLILSTLGAARYLGANALTAGFVLLVIVLFVATRSGLAAGVTASLVATAVLNYFFLPPVGTWHIADFNNWIALAAFLLVAAVSSRLVTLARQQTRRARARAAEVHALYELSVDLLRKSYDLATLGARALQALAATGSEECGVLWVDEEGDEVAEAAWSIGRCSADVRARAIDVRSMALESKRADGLADIFVPLVVRGTRRGMLVALGSRAERSAIESVAQILMLALEREELLAERAHVEALKESDALKTGLFRAISHDLITPMTTIGFLVDVLKRDVSDHTSSSTVSELDTELSRMRRRIHELLALAQLESGATAPKPEAIPPADLFRSARESLSMIHRPIHVTVSPDCPDLWADPSLTLEIVVNLLENADRASPEGVPVELVAGASDRGTKVLRLGVLDRGRGLTGVSAGSVVPLLEVQPRGLGLEIVREFAEANGGHAFVEQRDGGGIAAWVELPAAPEAAP